MLIFPAIDLKDGKVVRLHKGSFDTVHQVADDPVATARTFYEAGARHLHMVDLDGAKDGVRKNSGIVRAVADVGLNIELGGGIRSMEDIRAVFDLGVWRVVIGSAAVTDPDFVRAAIAAYGPERVAVGIDAKNGTVRTAGWVEDSQLDYLDFARSMESFGVRHIIFTDIDTDGMLAGPSCGRLLELKEAVGCRITASGGVSSNADLRALRNMELYAAIVGKAWYAGAVDLRQAVEECE
ncbi:MAG: 1-(5-phosphoribosyl)-5-[(5-phosphoribosylamino)methylideneamino]imidazole-4-carboxamide isomerase [Oscillospiraceae bacterium]|nr:1-(5-phosphoribosyl)-5-[(5-phosphoribosylamino)methylideneamino]imidazole-4-carboxamide isomerase [Oscillospiraceae bacterium]